MYDRLQIRRDMYGIVMKTLRSAELVTTFTSQRSLAFYVKQILMWKNNRTQDMTVLCICGSPYINPGTWESERGRPFLSSRQK